jgi:hypothetical protein
MASLFVMLLVELRSAHHLEYEGLPDYGIICISYKLQKMNICVAR